jgi:hypothetical protein
MHAKAVRRTRFLVYAGFQFLVLSTLAMLLFPGGTAFDASAQHYEFFDNFLSDLGSTVTSAGHANYLSSAMFAVGLGSVGIAMIGFATTWRAYAFARGRGRVFGRASEWVGAGSGLAFLGIALTPWDLLFAPHVLCVFIAFGLLVAFVACITLLLWLNDGDRRLVLASVAYLAALGAYIALGVAGPGTDSEHGHSVQVTGQKLVVYVSMTYLIVLAAKLRRGPLAMPSSAREGTQAAVA